MDTSRTETRSFENSPLTLTHDQSPDQPSKSDGNISYAYGVSQNRVQLSNFGLRFLAFTLDIIILGLCGRIFAYPAGVIMGMVFGSGLKVLSLLLWIFGPSWLYFTILESSSWQASLGKQLLGLKVVCKNGDRLSFTKAALRSLVRIPSMVLLFAGCIMAAFTEQKQALHDLVAGTIVIMADQSVESPGGIDHTQTT